MADGQQEGRARGRPGPDPALKARAGELRAAGMSDRAIGAELDVTHKTVGRWLAGQPKPQADLAEVARLREEPVTRTRSWREIGAELGISHETARRWYGRPES